MVFQAYVLNSVRPHSFSLMQSGNYGFVVGTYGSDLPCIIRVDLKTGEGKKFARNPSTFVLNDIKSNPSFDQIVAVGRENLNINQSIII